MIQRTRIGKSASRRLSLILILALVFTFLFGAFASAEKEYTFKYGTFKSDQFSLDIPDAISEVQKEDDSILLLSSEKQDIFLSIAVDEISGFEPDQILNYAEENFNATDKTFVASLWTSNDLDYITSTLKQTAKIDRDNMEMLEYRHNAVMQGQPWIAYTTIIHIKDTNYVCGINLLADNKRARTAILHYLTIIDSIIANPSATLGEGEWLCDNCGAVNSDNFCSKCGTPKPGSSFSSNTTETPVETQPVNQQETSVNSISTPQKETSTSHDNIVSIAKELAGLIAYTAKAPADGNTVSVNIEGKTILVHADFKYAMDVFYEYYKEYLDSINSLNISKMTSLALKIDEVDAALEKIDNMELSDGDMAYYMSIYAKILKIIGDLGRSK